MLARRRVQGEPACRQRDRGRLDLPVDRTARRGRPSRCGLPRRTRGCRRAGRRSTPVTLRGVPASSTPSSDSTASSGCDAASAATMKSCDDRSPSAADVGGIGAGRVQGGAPGHQQLPASVAMAAAARWSSAVADTAETDRVTGAATLLRFHKSDLEVSFRSLKSIFQIAFHRKPSERRTPDAPTPHAAPPDLTLALLDGRRHVRGHRPGGAQTTTTSTPTKIPAGTVLRSATSSTTSRPS